MIKIVDGNLFDNDAAIRINTINCVGVMGKGIALDFKRRYPLMFSEYKRVCQAGQVQIGRLYEWEGPDGTVLNFPTKRHWSEPSEYSYIDAGLDALRKRLEIDGRKVAIPALGCTNGHLEWEKVKGMILAKLDGLPNEILLYRPLEIQKMDVLPRLWLIDETDMYMAKEKLKAIRYEQLKDWDWCRFCDDSYSCMDEAFEAYMSEVCGSSMFNAGKMVVFYGYPSFHAKMADKFSEIAENVLVVVVAKIDKTTTFYSLAEKYKYAKIDDRLVFNERKGSHDEAFAWTSKRAKLLGLKMDDGCCAAIADSCSYKPNLIHAELEKLKHATHDGDVTRELIEMVAVNIGDANIMLLCDAIMNNDGDRAHIYLQRLIEHGEDGVKMCGFFMDWARKLSIAQASGGSPDKEVLLSLKKWDKEREKSIPMFEDIKGVTYSCKNLNNSNKPSNFPYDLLGAVGRLQMTLRGGGRLVGSPLTHDDQTLLLHRFVASLIKG